MHDRITRFFDAISEFFDQFELAGRRAFEAGQFQRFAEADPRANEVAEVFGPGLSDMDRAKPLRPKSEPETES